MSKKILIIDATKYGATAEITDKSPEVLRQADLQADIPLVANVRDITPESVGAECWRLSESPRILDSWRIIAMKYSHISLVVAGALSFGMAAFQTAISLVPAWSAYFGAPGELLSNPPLLLAAGLVVSIILTIFGLYGLSGAGVIRRLPLLRLGLLGIGLGYTLYGINVIPQLLVLIGIASAPQPVLMRNVIVFSVLLIAGLLYLTGLTAGWKHLSVRVPGGVQSTNPA